jgi:hypothetical protein
MLHIQALANHIAISEKIHPNRCVLQTCSLDTMSFAMLCLGFGAQICSIHFEGAYNALQNTIDPS